MIFHLNRITLLPDCNYVASHDLFGQQITEHTSAVSSIRM